MSTADNDEHDQDIEAEEGDDGEIRVKAAPRPAPRGPATEAAASSGAGNGNGSPPPRTTRPRSHHATAAAAGVGSAPANADPPNAETAPWTYKEADLMLGEMLGGEHPRSLRAYGKTPYDFQAEVRRSDGVGGQSVCIKTIPGQELQGSADVTPGEVLRNIVGDVHLVSAKGPVTYDIWFSWRSPQRQYGKGRLQMPAPEEIIALRNAMRTSQQPYQQPYPPPAQPQQPSVGYGAAPVSQQPPYQPPHGQYHPDGNPYGRREPAPAPSRDPEVSNLRAEVGELRGALGEVLEHLRGDRRAVPPTTPPAQQPQGFGGAPHDRPWPQPRRRERTEADELRDELDDLREEMADLRRGGSGRASGFGAAPAQPPSQPSRQPAPPPPVRGPGGEVYIDGIGWCIPQERVAHMVSQPPGAQPQAHAPPPPPPVAAPAVQPQAAAAPAARPVGVGVMPVSPLRGFIDSAREYLRDGKEIRKVAAELEEVFGGGGGDVGLGAAEDPQTPQTPEEPESVLPFASEVVGGDGPDAPKLFGQPIRYVVDKETGKFDLKGFAFANPGLMEKGVEIAGIAAEGFRNLTARAAANAGTAAQFPAGVGATPAPAQVVDNIPADAKLAQAHTNGAGSGSFPRV